MREIVCIAKVDVLGDASGASGGGAPALEASRACMLANEALLHRVVTGRPMSILKYAMTLDGAYSLSPFQMMMILF